MNSRRLVRGLGGVALAVGVVIATPAGTAVAAQPGLAAAPPSGSPAQEESNPPKDSRGKKEEDSEGSRKTTTPNAEDAPRKDPPRKDPPKTPTPKPKDPPKTTTPKPTSLKPRPPVAATPPPPTSAAAQAAARAQAKAAAKARADAARAAQELARERAAAAAEAAADFAAAQVRTTEAWNSRGRPHRMVVVRGFNFDVVTEGRLTGQVPRTAGPMTLATMDRALPADWVTLADGVARLSTAVVLTPGTTLDLGGVRTLRLTGGPTPPDAASIYTGSGRLTGRDVTVSSVDPATNEPMAAGVGRPFIVVAGGGRMDITDATFSDLGTLPTDLEPRTGVQFSPGSGGSLTRATFVRNTVGLRLAGTDGVNLDGVTVRESVSDGLALEGDRGTTLRGIVAERNGDNGVIVKGETSDRAITGITTSGNGEYGLALVGQNAPRITGVVTTADKTGGLRLNRSSGVLVSDFTATDQPIGVFTHVGSTGLVLERMRITGGRRGMVVEKSTTGLELKDSTIDGASAVGMSIGGHDVTLTGLSVAGSRTGVRIERGAGGIVASGLTLSGGEDGFVANPGSEQVILRDFVATSIGNDAVRNYSPDAQISGGRIVGADTGIVAGAPTTIADIAITEVDTGLRAFAGAGAAADRIDIAALAVGIDAAPASPVQLRDSRVHALQALRGNVQMLNFSELSLPPLNLLGAIGVPLVFLAVLLELMHSLRQRRFGRGKGRGRLPPPTIVPAGA